MSDKPCESNHKYREFDFWIGEWEVFDTTGKKVGENKIEKINNGCALLENWMNMRGIGGKSINYYDPSKDKWVQVWVDSEGEIIPVEGSFFEGAMRLEGKRILPDGTANLFRGMWKPLPNGEVNQFLEESTDNGENWNVWFNGRYVRKNS